MNDIDDMWEKHAQACSDGYDKDPRWKEVTALRKAGEHLKANGLVFAIRDDWGL